MIYLDHNATTPVHPDVFQAMAPYMQGSFGNPSSLYRSGREAKKALEESRAAVAAWLGAGPEEIVFTSGGTEADNTAIRGVTGALTSKGDHIITSAIEHHAVLSTCRALERDGVRVTYLPVDRSGRVDPDDVRKAVTPHTVLITVMHVNNETGVVQPVEEIGRIAAQSGVLFHSDTVQSGGKLPLSPGKTGAALMAFSAHKMYGPKGIGALYVKSGTPLKPLITGGGHERGVRAGTENVAGAAGFAKAVQLLGDEGVFDTGRLLRLRDHFEKRLEEAVDGIHIHGRQAPRIANTSSVSFAAVESESVLLYLDLNGICASAGSACSTGSAAASHVLTAMGVSPQDAQGSIRFSLGDDNTQQDIDATVDVLAETVKKLRAVSSVHMSA